MGDINKDLEYYAKIFSLIKRGFNSYSKSEEKQLSPYKPIFLLSVIQLIDENKIHQNRIFTNTLDYLNLENSKSK